jgi:formimidoylglutamase
MTRIPYLKPSRMPSVLEERLCDLIKPWDFKSSIDVGIVGVPFDSATAGRPGSRFGPDAIRLSFRNYTTYSYDFDVDIRKLRVFDLGDVDVVNANVPETHRRVEETLTAIFKLNIIPVIIGGDHSITYPSAKALCNVTNGKVGVLDFDAHNDLRIPQQGQATSGASFRQLLEIPGSPIKGENVVQIGIHGFLNSSFYKEYADEQGIRIFSVSEVKNKGIEEVIEEALDIASNGTNAIYLSMDVDCLDQAYAPGTNRPSPGGLSSWDLFYAAFKIGDHPLTRAMDITEISPPLDINNLTINVGTSIMLHFMGGVLKNLAE